MLGSQRQYDRVSSDCVSELRISIDRVPQQESSLGNSPVVRAVLRWLQDRKASDEEWLVVLDNVDDLSWGVNEILPKGQRGNVIITSQDEISAMLFKGGCEKVRVDIMQQAEVRNLLL